MSQLDFITNRRSIRRFTSNDISDEIINKLLDSVRWTPSWANTQCWEVIVVKRQDLKDRLKDILSPKNPATLAVQSAPVVMAMCAKLGKAGFYKGEAKTGFGDWFLYDTGLATQSLILTAHSLGLGSVITGSMNFDMAKEILEVPNGYELVTLVPIGYPDQDPSPPPRREIEEFTHNEIFRRK